MEPDPDLKPDDEPAPAPAPDDEPPIDPPEPPPEDGPPPPPGDEAEMRAQLATANARIAAQEHHIGNLRRVVERLGAVLVRAGFVNNIKAPKAEDVTTFRALVDWTDE